jgi:hypothetical protein
MLAVTGVLVVQAQSGEDSPETGSTRDAPPTPKLAVSADAVTIEAPRGTYVMRYARPSARYEKPEPLGADELAMTTADVVPGPPVVMLSTAADKRITDVMVAGVTVASRRGPRMQWLMGKDGVELVWDAQGSSDWTIERNGNLLTKAGDGHHVDPVPATDGTRYTISRAGDPTAYVARLPDYEDSLIGKDVRRVGALESPAGVTPPGATVFASRRDACDDVLASPAEPVSEQTADADREHLTGLLMGRDDIRSVGMSSCGSQPVVVIGTKNLSARVPAQGPGGTPVIAYKQRPIYAF